MLTSAFYRCYTIAMGAFGDKQYTVTVRKENKKMSFAALLQCQWSKRHAIYEYKYAVRSDIIVIF